MAEFIRYFKHYCVISLLICYGKVLGYCSLELTSAFN